MQRMYRGKRDLEVDGCYGGEIETKRNSGLATKLEGRKKKERKGERVVCACVCVCVCVCVREREREREREGGRETWKERESEGIRQKKRKQRCVRSGGEKEEDTNETRKAERK
jgi:hypothetical protein